MRCEAMKPVPPVTHTSSFSFPSILALIQNSHLCLFFLCFGLKFCKHENPTGSCTATSMAVVGGGGDLYGYIY